ncbi:hypothetical protein AVEN_208991-1 [Araneus ventricosus]|uniref:Uncharacterized protein n=1 Tax=Araneus ventricosus TaxID=182803 RepID=A0A4Y2CQ83_ARAVE|nr:hypothetical protein AVEN_208991-1 [Araneus ventricosus]
MHSYFNFSASNIPRGGYKYRKTHTYSQKPNPNPLTCTSLACEMKARRYFKRILPVIIKGAPHTQKPRRVQAVVMATSVTQLVVFLEVRPDRNVMFIQQPEFFRGRTSSLGGTFPTTCPGVAAPSALVDSIKDLVEKTVCLV